MTEKMNVAMYSIGVEAEENFDSPRQFCSSVKTLMNTISKFPQTPPQTDLGRTLRDHYSKRGSRNKLRTPRTLTRLMQQHRDNERHRHRGLNSTMLEISKQIPGYEESMRETKIVRLQRVINYICHLETHIQNLCQELDIDLEFKNLFLSPHIPGKASKRSSEKDNINNFSDSFEEESNSFSIYSQFQDDTSSKESYVNESDIPEDQQDDCIPPKALSSNLKSSHSSYKVDSPVESCFNQFHDLTQLPMKSYKSDTVNSGEEYGTLKLTDIKPSYYIKNDNRYAYGTKLSRIKKSSVKKEVITSAIQKTCRSKKKKKHLKKITKKEDKITIYTPKKTCKPKIAMKQKKFHDSSYESDNSDVEHLHIIPNEFSEQKSKIHKDMLCTKPKMNLVQLSQHFIRGKNRTSMDRDHGQKSQNRIKYQVRSSENSFMNPCPMVTTTEYGTNLADSSTSFYATKSQLNIPQTRVQRAPTLTTSQAEESAILFHSYAKPRPSFVCTKRKTATCVSPNVLFDSEKDQWISEKNTFFGGEYNTETDNSHNKQNVMADESEDDNNQYNNNDPFLSDTVKISKPNLTSGLQPSSEFSLNTSIDKKHFQKCSISEGNKENVEINEDGHDKIFKPDQSRSRKRIIVIRNNRATAEALGRCIETELAISKDLMTCSNSSNISQSTGLTPTSLTSGISDSSMQTLSNIGNYVAPAKIKIYNKRKSYTPIKVQNEIIGPGSKRSPFNPLVNEWNTVYNNDNGVNSNLPDSPNQTYNSLSNILHLDGEPLSEALSFIGDERDSLTGLCSDTNGTEFYSTWTESSQFSQESGFQSFSGSENSGSITPDVKSIMQL